MDSSVILNQMIILFLMMLIGLILFKLDIMNAEFNKRLTKILLNVTVPSLILHSVLAQTGERDTSAVITIFVVTLITYLILPLIAFALLWIFRVPPQDRGIYMVMTVYSNVGFMGFPVIQALLGSTAVFYAAIFNIVFNLSIYSIGVIMMHKFSASGDEKTTMNLKKLLNPGILFSLLSVIVYFLNVDAPFVIVETVGYIGSLTVPLAMMIVGATLANMKLKELFEDLRIYPYALVRQLVLPLLYFGVLKLTVKDSFVLGILAVLLMMPVANTAVLYANEYHGNEKLAAKVVFLTTLLSVVTIPLLVYICFK